jgi:hypothetical protein
MNYLDELFKRNQAGQPSLRMPSANYGDGQGMRMPTESYGDGLGLKPPASFGDVSSAASPQMNPMLAMSLLQQGQSQVQEMPTMQIPAGSNLSYEELLKMYGIQGLLG